MSTIDLVEGWTGPVVYVLKVDGVAQDLTGMAVSMVARDAHGTVINLSGTLQVTDQSNGEVTFTPATGDVKLRVSPMLIRFKVVDAQSKVVYFPNAEAEQWVVRK